MKILLLITGLGLGGAEKVVTSLADCLARKGHNVMLVYMTGQAVVLPKHTSIKIVDLGMAAKSDVLFAYIKLSRLIREFQPDVVHSHMVHANLLARLVRVSTPIKRLISTAHSSNEGGRMRMLGYRFTNFLVDQSTNVSEEAVLAFECAGAVRPGQMLVLHNGIDTDAFAFSADARMRLRNEFQIKSETNLLLAVGRFYESKDYPNLFCAIAQIPFDSDNYQLLIAGDGPLRVELELHVRRLGLGNRIKFLGARNDVASLMSAADIFVLSSAWEGFAMVVLEAMANEKVLVVTDCGGVREALGDAGYLVEPSNPEKLAKALQEAMNLSAAQRAALGKAARQRVVDYFSLNAVVEKWLDIYLGNYCVDQIT